MKINSNILGLLGVIFITLKLCGVIAWSWWLVTMPLWGGIACVLVMMIVWAVLTVLIALCGIAVSARK